MINGAGLVEKRLPTHMGVTHATHVSNNDSVYNHLSDFGFHMEMHYRNGLPWPITLVLRNGLAVTLPPVPGNWRTHSDLTVYVRYRFMRDVKIDVHRVLDEVDDKSPAVMQTLKNAINAAQANMVLNGHECTIAYRITRNALENAGGAVHIDELDMTVTVEQRHDVQVLHPESHYGRILKAQQDDEGCGSYRIIINDPYKEFGERFLNLSGRIVHIPTTQDFTRPPGVYTSSMGNVGGDIYQEHYHPFESAEAELMLFRTVNDAKTLGNMPEVQKRELENFQHQLKLDNLTREKEYKETVHTMDMAMAKEKHERSVKEAELQRQIADLKKEEMRREEEHRRLEAELAKQKVERESKRDYEKDFYERRSYERKDASEFVKWLPAFVVGVGLVISKLI